MAFDGGQYQAEVLTRTALSKDLIRLELGGAGLEEFTSTGLSDEWISLIPPDERTGRFYTVRAWDGRRMVIDVVVHERGAVTQWASGDCVGDMVMVSAPKGSFAVPSDAEWVYLVGDLTALPAMARAADDLAGRLPVRIWAEASTPVPEYFHGDVTDVVTWTAPADDQSSRLGALTETLDWPSGPGYFWMAGESAQMRAVRRYVMRTLGWPHSAYNLMGYWRAR